MPPHIRPRVNGEMPTRCYSLLLGARNTPGRGKRFTARDDARLREVTFRHFRAGFTILNANGGWLDPRRGRFVKEASRQILICTDQPRRLRAWCDELAFALEQEELLVVEIGPAVTYRRGKHRARPTIRQARL